MGICSFWQRNLTTFLLGEALKRKILWIFKDSKSNNNIFKVERIFFEGKWKIKIESKGLWVEREWENLAS